MELLKKFLLVLGMLCVSVAIFVVSDPAAEYTFVLLNWLVGILFAMFGLLLLVWHLEAKRES